MSRRAKAERSEIFRERKRAGDIATGRSETAVQK